MDKEFEEMTLEDYYSIPKSEGLFELINGVLYQISSPASKSRDYILKLEKYRNAGVREYWILDYEVNRVSVYCFSEDRALDTLTLYTFDDRVPVRIFDDLEIDLSRIRQTL